MNLDPNFLFESRVVERSVTDRFHQGNEFHNEVSTTLEISNPEITIPPQLEHTIAIVEIETQVSSIQQQTIHFLKDSALEFRVATQRQLNAGVDGSSVVSFVDNCYRTMLTATFDNAKRILSEKGMHCPTEFAVGGLGSLARNETSPFSDLDFCIFVAEDNDEVRHYFKQLMTEADDILRQLGDKGFAFCKGELNPPYFQRWEENGVVQQSHKTIGSPQLLNTPKEMVKHSIESYSAEHEDGSSTGAEKKSIEQCLSQVGFVYGNEDLVDTYHREQDRLMDRSVESGITGYFSSRKIRHEKGLAMMKIGEQFDRHTDSIQINLDSGMAIDIKKGMQRQIQQVVSGLCMYHGISELNTVLALDILVEKRVVHSSLAEKMKSSYSFASALRLKAQLQAEKEEDFVTTGTGVDYYKLSHEERVQMGNEARFLFSLTQLRRLFVEGDGKRNVFLQG